MYPMFKSATRAVALTVGLAGAPFAALAATITGVETQIEVTADLTALGLAGAPVGTATVDVSGENPVFTFPITGGTFFPDTGNALIEHTGSGVELSALADPATSVAVGDFLIDTASAQVFGNVFGTDLGPQSLFDITELSDAGATIAISEFLAGALTSIFGAPDLEGATFGIAVPNVSVAPAAVPLPAGLPMLAAGLLAVGLLRRPRANM